MIAGVAIATRTISVVVSSVFVLLLSCFMSVTKAPCATTVDDGRGGVVGAIFRLCVSLKRLFSLMIFVDVDIPPILP